MVLLIMLIINLAYAASYVTVNTVLFFINNLLSSTPFRELQFVDYMKVSKIIKIKDRIH